MEMKTQVDLDDLERVPEYAVKGLVRRKLLEAIENTPAEDFKLTVVELLRRKEDIASLPWVLGVQQAVWKSVSEFCKSH
jgi:hypothetical protein